MGCQAAYTLREGGKPRGKYPCCDLQGLSPWSCTHALQVPCASSAHAWLPAPVTAQPFDWQCSGWFPGLHTQKDATSLSPHMLGLSPTSMQTGSPLLAALSGTSGSSLSARCTAAPVRPWASAPRFGRHPAGKAPHSALPGGPLQLRHTRGLQAGSCIMSTAAHLVPLCHLLQGLQQPAARQLH